MSQVVSVKKGVLLFEGEHLAINLYQPVLSMDGAPAVAIITNGLAGDQSTEYPVSFAREFVKAGVAAITFDNNGCGQSSGKFEDFTLSKAFDDLTRVISHAKELGFKRIFLVGNSVNGIVVARAACENPEISGIALLSAPTDIKAWLVANKDLCERWRKDGSFKFPTAKGKALNRSFLDDALPFSEQVMPAKLNTPMLVLHASHDSIIPIRFALRLGLERESQIRVFPTSQHSLSPFCDSAILAVVAFACKKMKKT